MLACRRARGEIVTVPAQTLARSVESSDAYPPVALADRLRALCAEAVHCHASGRLADAIARYQQALSLQPDLPVVNNNLGLALAGLGGYEAAIEAYRRAIAIKPDDPEALCNWGIALLDLERFDEAEAKFRDAIALDPGFAGAHNDLGLMLTDSGRFLEARQAAERAVHLAPQKPAYYQNLAAVRPFVPGDPYITALERMAEDIASLHDVDRIYLHFAMAKAYQDTGRPESAFRQLLAGSGLKRRQLAYDEVATLDCMDRLRALFTPDFIKERERVGDPSVLPIFIIGMPRSGTTLIEQILASHPDVFGAGEIKLFDQAAGSMRDVLPGPPPFPDMVSSIPLKHFRTLGALYLGKLTERAPTAMRIVDKMTTNFLFAGLIHLALPNATIIHAVRDPIDTCVSCFWVHFSRGHMYSYDLAELGRYYRHYRALMTHWHSVLPPGRILDVHYEDLVGNVEGVARRVVAHCGLAWDARCLDFHRNDRPVRTASAVQVRRQIYQGSVGRCREYENFLGPLLAELEPANASITT